MINIKNYSLSLLRYYYIGTLKNKCKFHAEYPYRVFDMGTLDWASDAPNFMLN